MDPQREFVHRQPCADPKPGRQQLRSRAIQVRDEAKEAEDEQEDDSPHEGVQVTPALRYPTARPPWHLRAANEARACPDEQEREQEGGQQYKSDALGLNVQKMSRKLESKLDAKACRYRRHEPLLARSPPER